MESQKVYIRESEFQDCKYFSTWEKTQSVIEFFAMDSEITYEDIVEEYFKSKADSTKMLYTIVLRSTNEPIGKIYVSRIDMKNDSMDITRIYIADDTMRNQGYGRDALRLMLEYAFINMHMERVTLDYMVENKVAEHLYEDIGFTREGTMRNAGKQNGRYVDLVLMSILRAEYYEKIHN